MKFKVGDNARVKSGLIPGIYYGGVLCASFVAKMAGHVVKVKRCFPDTGHYLVSGSAWYVTDEMLDRVEDSKVVITTHGNVVKAALYENEKCARTAEAKCSPDDTFSFAFGARLAMERLLQKPVEHYNGKVVCVDPRGCTMYTKGKIYQFKNGLLVDDRGKHRPVGHLVSSFADFASCSCSKWLEIVE